MSTPTVTVTLRLPPQLAEQLNREAERRHISKNALTIEVIEVGLRDLPAPNESSENPGRAS